MDTTPVIVGVPKETFPRETRVAMVPPQVPGLTKAGLRVLVEASAGIAAGYSDQAFVEHGAEIATREEVIGSAQVLLQVRTCGANPIMGGADLELHPSGQIVIGLAEPLDACPAMVALGESGVTLFGMELIPRIARAQNMDVLSSQSMIAGYKAVIDGAGRIPKIFPMMTTAAGTVAPARVFVIGAGVAGLSSIATAKRLGAMVEAYDVRPAAQEDVESLGAKLVTLSLGPGDAEDTSGYAKDLGESFYRRQQELLTEVTQGVDLVVANAAIPGKRAPVLLTEAAVGAMPAGGVVIDLAAARGGNCALTVPDEEIVTPNGVTILGPTNLPATVPFHASQLIARNLTNLLLYLVRDGQVEPDWDDEIVQSTLVARDGLIVNDRVKETLEGVAA
jgi:NAD(P) transhydrogenase subunit alpha